MLCIFCICTRMYSAYCASASASVSLPGTAGVGCAAGPGSDAVPSLGLLPARSMSSPSSPSEVGGGGTGGGAPAGWGGWLAAATAAACSAAATTALADGTCSHCVMRFTSAFSLLFLAVHAFEVPRVSLKVNLLFGFAGLNAPDDAASTAAAPDSSSGESALSCPPPTATPPDAKAAADPSAGVHGPDGVSRLPPLAGNPMTGVLCRCLAAASDPPGSISTRNGSPSNVESRGYCAHTFTAAAAVLSRTVAQAESGAGFLRGRTYVSSTSPNIPMSSDKKSSSTSSDSWSTKSWVQV
jgi:hypothetical protein